MYVPTVCRVFLSFFFPFEEIWRAAQLGLAILSDLLRNVAFCLIGYKGDQ